MKVEFRALPGISGDVPRPLIDVGVQGMEHGLVRCLADTGSLHNRFGLWVARLAGIDLSEIEPHSLGVGGRPVLARTVTVSLALDPFEWEAPVSFCEPWPWDFQILGQEGFFRWFRVVFEAAGRAMQVEPHP